MFFLIKMDWEQTEIEILTTNWSYKSSAFCIMVRNPKHDNELEHQKKRKQLLTYDLQKYIKVYWI